MDPLWTGPYVPIFRCGVFSRTIERGIEKKSGGAGFWSPESRIFGDRDGASAALGPLTAAVPARTTRVRLRRVAWSAHTPHTVVPAGPGCPQLARS